MPLPVILVELLKAAGLLGAELALDRALSKESSSAPAPAPIAQAEDRVLELDGFRPERDEYDDALDLLREPMFQNKPDLILEVRNR